jgi:hypothetical protein
VRRRDEYGIVMAVSVGIAICSLLTAVLASDACGGDGSFDPDGPAATPSSFCEGLHFPGVPDSASSWALFAALFIGPAALALLIGLAGTLSRRRRLRLAGAYIGLALMVIVAVVAVLDAETGFAGY